MQKWSSVLCSIALTLSATAETPKQLTWQNFDQVADDVRLKPSDETYQKVSWLDTVLQGQQQAQRQDKPLLLWLYFGDPRANC
ncbi:hypothetical protein JO972_10390 [Verrucomicrobiaceae bacterium 5K15]|uniref:Uncharacterized protein n=1 Tax=Oceaniferula flava TaxID=2800421 RepID=A0AAE2SCK0_9BACT|nr:hypothetical protein [Oceaniferula flavus]MBK1855368.1 hypothetical protein [Oceaniferula flavus]MBM1136674.1 hypothetical protein [Oceaniferula flavus]